jgi:Lon-like protease
VKIRIDAGDIGGPSAGLAFALDIVQELGRDVAQGHRVAATGELALNGAVGPIGGVKQKTLGARRAGVDVFLVPAGDNAREARRYAGDLRIVPVQNFPQALRSLATLGPKG